MKHKDLTIGEDYFVSRGTKYAYGARVMRLIDDTLVFPFYRWSAYSPVPDGPSRRVDTYDNGGRPRCVIMRQVSAVGEFIGEEDRVPLTRIKATIADHAASEAADAAEREAERLVRQTARDKGYALDQDLADAGLPFTVVQFRGKWTVGSEAGTLDEAAAIVAYLLGGAS